MSASENIAAINDARALLAAMLENGCAFVCVRTDATEITLSRDSRPAPLRTEARAISSGTGAHTPDLAITAPHVATLAWVATEGAMLRQGDPLAKLNVLGDEIVLRAPADGQVTQIQATSGDLLEYAFPIALLSER